MFLRKSLVFLMLFLVISSASAARKTKRPAKPAKTFPRTNVTPSPQQQPIAISSTIQQQQATSSSSTSTSTTSSTTPAPVKQENVSVEEAELTGNVMNDNELPKPLNGASAANGNMHQELMPQESKTEMPGDMEEGGDNGMIEEECDPDMIGFEIITG